MIALFHELVHVLDIILENGREDGGSEDGLLFSSDFDDFLEYVAIQQGVDGHSENALRKELNKPIRVNHRGCDFPPFSKELASKNDDEKIKVLQAYVEAGASTDAKLMMQHISAENIAKSGILESAVKLKYWPIVFKLLEAGKDQWTPKQLKKVLCKVIRNEGHENFNLIFNARRGKWPIEALEPALIIAGKLWEKEIFKLLFIEGHDHWSFDRLAWALEMAITVKTREKFGFGKGIQKKKWGTEILQLILNSRRGKWPLALLTEVLKFAKANKQEEICLLISAATQEKSS